MRETDQRKDEFLATLADELRKRLASIRSALQVIQLAKGDAEAMKLSCSVMERQIGQMARLIDDLMDLSRINGGKIARQRTILSVAAAVERCRRNVPPVYQRTRTSFGR